VGRSAGDRLAIRWRRAGDRLAIIARIAAFVLAVAGDRLATGWRSAGDRLAMAWRVYVVERVTVDRTRPGVRLSERGPRGVIGDSPARRERGSTGSSSSAHPLPIGPPAEVGEDRSSGPGPREGRGDLGPPVDVEGKPGRDRLAQIIGHRDLWA
jgi:hypothetical protein